MRPVGEGVAGGQEARPEPGVCGCGGVLEAIEFPPGRWRLAVSCDVCIYADQLADSWARTHRVFEPRFVLHGRSSRTFGGYDCPPGDGAALERAREFKVTGSQGLYLWGKSGAGKTHLAMAIASHAATRVPVVQGVAQAEIPDEVRLDVAGRLEVLYPAGCPWPIVHRVESATVPQVFAAMRAAIDTDGQSPDRIREELVRAGLLVLDDLGTEKITHWTREILFDVLDRRFALERPTVITSNLNLEQLEQRLTATRDDPFGVRVASRIAGACRVVEVRGADYRRKHGDG